MRNFNVMVPDNSLHLVPSSSADGDVLRETLSLPRQTPNTVLDGFADAKSLSIVVNRVTLASCIYGVASSIFIAAISGGFHMGLWSLGPLEMAILNLSCIAYFVTIMLPFSLLLAWTYRFKRDLPYQQQTVVINLPYEDAFATALGAGLAIAGSSLTCADESAGKITWTVSGFKFTAKQELVLQMAALSANETILTVVSTPSIHPVEYLLFGYTLTVDSGRNKANVDSILSFIRCHGSRDKSTPPAIE